MPSIDMRRLPPGKLVTLANSNPTFGAILTINKLTQHRHEAGAAICGTDHESGMPLLQTVDMIKYLRWLLERRHRKRG